MYCTYTSPSNQQNQNAKYVPECVCVYLNGAAVCHHRAFRAADRAHCFFISSLRNNKIKNFSDNIVPFFYITHRLFNVSFLFRPGRIDVSEVQFRLLAAAVVVVVLFVGGGVPALSSRSRDRPTAILQWLKAKS